eukprot:3523999-Prorocentrum_lima.AAC.2
MPADDFSRLSMASAVETMPTQVPATKAGLAGWLGDYHSRLEMALKMKCALEPRMIMTILVNVAGKVIKEDDNSE